MNRVVAIVFLTLGVAVGVGVTLWIGRPRAISASPKDPSPSTVSSAVARATPASQPANRDPPAGVLKMMDRIGWLRSAMIQFQQDYLANEGYQHRGLRFQRLAGAIEGEREKVPVMEYDVLVLLGPPDYGDADQRGSELIYLYDRTGQRDWYVVFEFDDKGQLKLMGWNGTSQIDLSKYKRFPQWQLVHSKPQP